MRADDVLVLRGIVPADPDVAWRLLVSPEGWWPGLTLSPEVGGRFLERWEDETGRRRTTSGSVLAVRPGRALVLDWRDDDWTASTTVSLRVEPADGTGSVVVVEHGGWAAFGSAGTALRDAHAAGWAVHLRDLAAAAERATADP